MFPLAYLREDPQLAFAWHYMELEKSHGTSIYSYKKNKFTNVSACGICNVKWATTYFRKYPFEYTTFMANLQIFETY